jgi:predicted RNA-binding Zn ribbon-like protein
VVTKRVTDLELVGGAVALDFANTREGDPGPDHLREFDDLAAWGAHAGVIDAGTAERLAGAAPEHPSDAERALERALRLRTAVDRIFRALAEGREPAAGALGELRRIHAQAVAHGRLVRGGGRFDWTWDGEDLDRVLWPVAGSAVDLLRSGPLDRLKACAACPWLFLDLSRNRSRRWCSMNECGGRAKMRRYRARRATAGR